MKNFYLSRQLLSLSFLLVTVFVSCRKNDVIVNTLNAPAKDEFFKLPANVDPAVAEVAADLKKQDSVLHFLPSFIEKNGIPRWDKVFYQTDETSFQNSSSARTSSDSNAKQGLFLIPLQSTTSNDIKSYITCYKHSKDLYTYRLYNKDTLNNIHPHSDSAKKQLMNTMAVFGYFEKNINKRDSIKVSGPGIATIKGTKLRFVKTSTNRSAGSSANLRTSCTVTSISVEITFSVRETSYETELWVGVVVNITLDCSGGGGGGFGSGGFYGYNQNLNGNGSYYGDPWGSGGGGYNGNYWWNFGSGWPWSSGFSDPNDPTTWQHWWTGGGATGYSSTVSNLINQFGLWLNPAQSSWLTAFPSRADEIYNYLLYTTQTQSVAKEISIQHLNQMMSDQNYLSFVINHAQTGAANTVWWEDDSWLSNSYNITFDLEENQANQYDQLNAAEKALVKLYPIEAWIMKGNRADAENETIAIYGNNGLNDKSDAFRHAFFNAMNQRDCGLDRNGFSIAKKFSDAHETSTPSQLQLEKDMDLFNNNIGHLIGGEIGVNMFTSDSYLSNKVLDKLVNGELRYLSPTLTPSQDPNFWGTGGVNNPLTATHGITSSTTLTPTNQ